MKNTILIVKNTVLVVEDERAMTQALADKCTLEGFGVLTAKDGEEGLEVALREHPDIILLDIIMPKMDGITMLKKLRRDEWGKKAKVIILSNLSDEDRVSDAIEQGTYDYLVKADWKLDDIITRIRKRLQE